MKFRRSGGGGDAGGQFDLGVGTPAAVVSCLRRPVSRGTRVKHFIIIKLVVVEIGIFG